jgi:sialate O-acetylesterase
VTVDIAGQTAAIKADAGGAWRTTLPALTGPGPYEMKVSSGSETVRLEDVLVGEVWIAAGQSNMARTMERVPGCAAEIPAMADEQLRFFQVKCNARAQLQDNLAGTWKKCLPKNAPSQSAIAYYFARTLRRELKKPVGVIVSAWGGTSVAPWTPLPSLESDPALRVWLDDFEKAKAALPSKMPEYEAKLAAWKALPPETRPAQAPRPPLNDNQNGAPANLYNAMIHPLVPLAIRGFIWYQGESDALDKHTARYTATFRTMISAWRAAWGDSSLPFYFVQLPRYLQPPPRGIQGLPAESEEWASLRTAQAAALDLPHTGMAVTADSGDADNLHPDTKEIVGTRLGRLVLQEVAGLDLHARFPAATGKVQRIGSVLKIRVTEAGEGLKTTGGAPATFGVIGKDGKFTPAEARIEGDTLRVTVPAGVNPVRVCYVWGPQPEATVINAYGQPLAPFNLDCTAFAP